MNLVVFEFVLLLQCSFSVCIAGFIQLLCHQEERWAGESGQI